MTEQEKREKEIEEMVKDIELSCDTNNDIVRCRELNDCSRCQARYLIEKCHYRKSDEVRKETATQFLFEAKRIIAEYAENSVYGIMFAEAYCRLLKTAIEKFGVEVGE